MASLVGVDLGSVSVDCAVIAKKGKVIELKEYFSFKKEGVGEDKTTDIMKLIGEFDSRKLNSSKASISIPDKNFLLISFKLPKLPPKEKDIAIRAEIEQKLPFPLEEAAFDVIRLNPKEVSENDYVAFCTRLSDVTRYHGLASNYNLVPERALTETIANLNCAEFNGYMTQKEISYLLVDIGAMHVGFTLVTNGLPWLTFCLAPKDTFNAEEGVEFDSKKFLEEQMSDIGKIISSFEEKSVVAAIRKVLLFGKTELLDYCQEKIAALTPLNIERVDPLKNIEIAPEIKEKVNLSLVSSVAIGLALSGTDSGGIGSVTR
ncbi:MAG: pilus assembly protein PilM [Bdellovibrionota bacterium]